MAAVRQTRAAGTWDSGPHVDFVGDPTPVLRFAREIRAFSMRTNLVGKVFAETRLIHGKNA
jgi:hypothetical protein